MMKLPWSMPKCVLKRTNTLNFSLDSSHLLFCTQLYYARCGNMVVLPTFDRLPEEGPVRLILVKAVRTLKKKAEADTGGASYACATSED